MDLVVTSIIPIGPYPHDPVITDDGSTVYVLSAVADDIDATLLSVVDTAAETVTTTTVFGTYTGRGAIALSPDGGWAYLSDGARLYKLDTVSNDVSGPYSSVSGIQKIVFNPNAVFAYVSTIYQTVVVLDTATSAVVATIPLGAGLGFGGITMAANPDSTRVYAANATNSALNWIDTQPLDAALDSYHVVIDTLPMPNPYGVSVTPDGTQLYVSGYDDANVPFVRVMSTDSGETMDVLSIEFFSCAVDFSTDGSRAFVVGTPFGDLNQGVVAVVDTATVTIVATVPITSAAGGVTVSPDGSHVYVTEILGTTLSVIT